MKIWRTARKRRRDLPSGDSRRRLAFEQCEDRLALATTLSATIPSDGSAATWFDLTAWHLQSGESGAAASAIAFVGFDASATTQGFIDIQPAFTASDAAWAGGEVVAFSHTGALTLDTYGADRWNEWLLANGHGLNPALDSGDHLIVVVPASVTTIPTPGVLPQAPNEIPVAEALAPLSGPFVDLREQSQRLAEREPVDMHRGSEAPKRNALPRLTTSQGREAAFEVAAFETLPIASGGRARARADEVHDVEPLSSVDQPADAIVEARVTRLRAAAVAPRSLADARQTQPANHQVPTASRENEPAHRSATAEIITPTVIQPALATARTGRVERSESDAAQGETDSHQAAIGERDAAFAAWTGVTGPVSPVVERERSYASWSVLAALAAGSWALRESRTGADEVSRPFASVRLRRLIPSRGKARHPAST